MKLNGINELKANLKALEVKSVNNIKNIVKANAADIQRDATQNAPNVYKYSGGGSQAANNEIKGNIQINELDPLNWEVTLNTVMGVYAEFGTGAYVDVPIGWEDVAWSYYVNGKGLMLPQPFFIPAFRKGSEQFKKDIERELNRLKL